MFVQRLIMNTNQYFDFLFVIEVIQDKQIIHGLVAAPNILSFYDICGQIFQGKWFHIRAERLRLCSICTVIHLDNCLRMMFLHPCQTGFS